MKVIISIISIALLLTGCTKKITLDYKANQSRITIEGNITNEPGPYYVKVTRSISLPETGSYPAIDNAIVTISDDAGNTETLTPEGNGLYRTGTLAGIEGRTYTLSVVAGNQTYTAQSTMPRQVAFDDVKIDEMKVAGDTERNIIPVYLDPIERGNKYRFVLSVNDKLISQHLVLNDEIKNGAVNSLKLEINDDDLKLKPGDHVSVTMQCIDENVALFYTTLALIANSGPGGGTTPNNPPSNISNGALGIFSAHTVATKQITIP